MIWNVWQRKPAPAVPRFPAPKVEEYEVDLVHWTEEKECRSVSVKVDADGSVTVEHSTTEHGDNGVDVEHVTRVTLNGWED